jgi:2-polyprenyl-3-methyl-5-hydroxy-6-metoxy-1,4-benzoquinol methylase
MYRDKDKKYFGQARFDLIGLIPVNEKNKILEIGAGNCETLVEIKRLKLAEEVTGIELVPLPGSQQENPGIDRLITADIEKIDRELPENYFDVIICGDVLEHLVDPWRTMKKIYKYLKEDGILITSMPNIREYHIMYRIFFLADFRYSDSGILDRTHLRFFCKKNILSLLTSSGFRPVSVNPVFRLDEAQRKNRIIDMITLGIFRDFLTAQYIIVSKKKDF